MGGKEVHADFAQNLSAIVETQKLIQTLQLDLGAAAKLVAERVQKITNASGAAIGILEKSDLVYRAATGTAAVDAETRVATAASLSADCLSQGSAVNYPDADVNSQARAKLFRERDVRSFIAVPVYHAGQVAGVLELRFTRVNSFREADLRTAELMAGLLSESMATAARMKWKDALASERQSMLEALERIKPQLERLGTQSSAETLAAGKPAEARLEHAVAAKGETSAPRPTEKCSICGSDFFDKGEAFCGICGSARPAASPASAVPHDIPTPARTSATGKISSPTVTPYGAENPPNGNFSAGTKAVALPESLQELIELSAIQQNPAAHVDNHFEKREAPKLSSVGAAGSHLAPREESNFFTHAAGSMSASRSNQAPAQLTSDQFAPPIERTDVAKSGEGIRVGPVDLGRPSEELPPYPWGSAKKAQQWLETVKTHRSPASEWMTHQWRTRRANIYIGVAGLILLIVISGWEIRPASTAIAGNASPVTTGRHQAPPAPQLTPFEKLLVSLGLAEAPPAPVYMGNPDTLVWVDVHTALYHCPGSELFGKAPDGRLSTQRDAQQDQFAPANRKPCP